MTFVPRVGAVVTVRRAGHDGRAGRVAGFQILSGRRMVWLEPVDGRLVRGWYGLHEYEPPAGTEALRECWDHYWGDKAARTRAKVRSVWIDFFEFAVRERGLRGNPARALAAPKKRDTPIEVFSERVRVLELELREACAQMVAAEEMGQ